MTAPFNSSNTYKQQIGVIAKDIINVQNNFSASLASMTPAETRVAVQAVLDSATVGQTVYFSAGTYIVDRVNPGTSDWCLNVTQDGTVVELSPLAIIKLADAEIVNTSDKCFVLQISADNVTIQGRGVIDGNFSAQTDTTVGDEITTRVGLYSVGTWDNILVRDIEVKNSNGDGIFFFGTDTSNRLTNVVIDNTRVINCRESILWKYVDFVKVINNTVIGNQDAGAEDGIEPAHSANFIVANNTITLTGSGGIDMWEKCYQGVISGNVIFNCNQGIQCGYTGASSSLMPQDITIIGNTIGTITSTFNGNGILIHGTGGAFGVLIDGNTIRNITAANKHGISVPAGLSEDITISNNLIDGTASGADGINVGIVEPIIIGNRVNNVGSVGIAVTGRNSIVKGNFVKASGSDSIDISPAANYSICNDNSIKNAGAIGIHVSSQQDTISGNIIDGAVNGIVFAATGDHCVCSGNLITATSSVGLSSTGTNIVFTGNNLPVESLYSNGNNCVITGNIVNGLSNASGTDNLVCGNRVNGTPAEGTGYQAIGNWINGSYAFGDTS